MDRIRIVANELINPSLDNPPLWYKWGSNQAAHFVLGAITAWVLTTAGFVLYGEYPSKEFLFAMVFFGYVSKELIMDKINGWDTFNDTMFYAVLGGGGAILSFDEISAGEWAPRVNPYILTAFLVVFCLYLIVGVLKRVDVND